MTLWKIYCEEKKYPGMWLRWFVNQCVAIGWHSEWGYPLKGQIAAPYERGWSRARNALREIEIGDYIVVTLSNHRVARIGQVTGKAIRDSEWDPLVPKSSSMPDGEMGRRILVRWDMTTGPQSLELVVSLPNDLRLSGGELRPTLSKVHSISLNKLQKAMNDETNWVGLWSHFDYEKALSGYIAAYPHRLEDGLLPHPNEKIRERVFKDRSRSDVILIDRKEIPVIVECKQNQPTVADIRQLRRYLKNLKTETKKQARGILVHGGSLKLRPDVKRSARRNPAIEIVRYKLDVEFTACN